MYRAHLEIATNVCKARGLQNTEDSLSVVHLQRELGRLLDSSNKLALQLSATSHRLNLAVNENTNLG